MRSVRVVLPESICAEMPMFRTFSIFTSAIASVPWVWSAQYTQFFHDCQPFAAGPINERVAHRGLENCRTGRRQSIVIPFLPNPETAVPKCGKVGQRRQTVTIVLHVSI